MLLFLARLLVWLLLRDRSRYVAERSAEALKFQVLAVLTAAAVTLLSLLTFGLAALLLLPLIGAWLVLVVVATVAVGRGQHYRYPVSWRIVR